MSFSNASFVIRVAGLFRFVCASGRLIQRTTEAIPTQNRAETCEIVNPSLSRMLKTLRRKSGEYVMKNV